MDAHVKSPPATHYREREEKRREREKRRAWHDFRIAKRIAL